MSRYYAFFNLFIGSETIEYSMENNTENMMEMTFTRIVGVNSESLVFTLYDDSALYLENLILNSNRTIKFNYGYSKGEVSPLYTAMILKYNITFEGAGTVLVIECSSQGIAEASQVETKEYPNMGVDEIAKKVAEEKGWMIGHIEKTKPIKSDSTAPDGTESLKSINRCNETLPEFLSKLSTYAISEATGKGNYLPYLEDRGGVKTFSFSPLENMKGRKKNFESMFGSIQQGSLTENTLNTVNNAQNNTDDKGTDNSTMSQDALLEFSYVLNAPTEEIISFTPEYGETLTALMGSNSVKTEYQDTATNEYHKTETTTSQPVSEVTTRKVVDTSARSASEMETISQALWTRAADLVYKANLVLKGKPNIQPTQVLKIAVLTRDGLVHHSSGLYYISKVTDAVQDGVYTTTLELIKNANGLPSTATEDSSGTNPDYSNDNGPVNEVPGNSDPLIIIKDFVSDSILRSKTSGTSTKKFVVVHNAEGGTAKSIRDYVQSKASEVSFHYSVDDKEVRHIMDKSYRGWHAGDEKHNHKGFNAPQGANGNRDGIGVEIGMDYRGITQKYKKAEDNGAKLVAYLLKQNGWGIGQVFAHKHFSGKECPGSIFKGIGWQGFLGKVQYYLNHMPQVIHR